MSTSVLIVDDDKALLKALQIGLRAFGYSPDIADGGPAALERLEERRFDVLLVDLGMPEVDGFAVMRHALREGRCRAVIVITGQDSVPIAVRAMAAGAANFITKPFEPDVIHGAIAAALQLPGGAADGGSANLRRWREKYAPEVIGQTPACLKMLEMVKKVADTECEVLIEGESGTGKELVARAIHAASRRAHKPFVAINCAAIPKELMESEIFGHAKGAFTGATERREGRFQAADGGTLFLDEVGEMDPALQAKFLRVIQDKEYTPVGESRPRKADVRIISATNRNLAERARDNSFRQDLYFRLNVIPIRVPSLRERGDDIPLLAARFIEQANRRHQRKVAGVDEEALALLVQHPWTGNVREMRNLIERIVVLKSESGPIRAVDLPEFVGSEKGEAAALELPEEGLDLRQALTSLEQQLMLDALRRSGGNKAKAAKLLGLKRTTLIERIKKLNLPDNAY